MPSAPGSSRLSGGPGRIRTFVGEADGFTARSLWPLGHRPRTGTEPIGPGSVCDSRTVTAGACRHDGWVPGRCYGHRMPTFDVVSEVDMQEVRNAVDQAARELAQRFDFKGTDSSVELGDDEIRICLLYTSPSPRDS